MLQRSPATLPRRTTAYLALLLAGSLVWIAVCLWIAADYGAQAERDAICLTHGRKALSRANLERLRGRTDELQTLVEQVRAGGHFRAVAIVEEDGRVHAYAPVEKRPENYLEPRARRWESEGVRHLRFAEPETGQWVHEYRFQLADHQGKRRAALHLEAFEPSRWEHLTHGPAGAFGWIVLGPTAFVVLGMVALRRSAAPVAAIEDQLARAALAVSPGQLELQEVDAPGPSAFGWNRLVAALRQCRQQSPLCGRVEAAISPLKAVRSYEVLNSFPDGVAIVDEQNRIAFANRSLAALCAGSGDAATLAGQTVEGLLGLASQSPEALPLLAPSAQGRSVTAELKRVVDGSPQVLRVGRYPRSMTDLRQPRGQVWVVRDITQQHLATQMRDQLLQTASHELRTPLTNLRAYAEMLALDEDINVEKQKEFCNIINSEATRLARLVEDLLSVSSMEMGALSVTRQETDIGRLFEEVVNRVKPQMEQKSQIFETFFPEKWPKLQLDKDKVCTAVVNVLGNAAKYTPEGGLISLRVTASEHQLTIMVEDNGIGIPADDLPRLFDKFFRGSDPRVQRHPGSGLGLALVKEVFRMHGGTVKVQSAVDRGTTFTLQLPIL